MQGVSGVNTFHGRSLYAPKRAFVCTVFAFYSDFGPVNPRHNLPGVAGIYQAPWIPLLGMPDPYLNFLSIRFPLLMTGNHGIPSDPNFTLFRYHF